MIQNRIRIATSLITMMALAAAIAGCRIRTEKDANGEAKKVTIDTPFGGLHVNTDQTTAADLGLPVYPGAQPVTGDDKHKSADVHLGFGDWELRVRAVSYSTPDNQDQVVAFYKKALARYGDVITCRDNASIGSPTVTAEGLTCDDHDTNTNVKIDRKDYNTGKDSLELKAGSKRRQHIVGFEDSKQGETRFALVALDLPAGMDAKAAGSD